MTGPGTAPLGGGPAARPPLAEVLAAQADACAMAGSPLYARVLRAAVGDVERGGPVARVLAGHEDDPFGSALALRFLGAVHRVVLEGRAPELAAHYPSAGGIAGGPASELEGAFLATVEAHAGELAASVEHGVQTNEVGRSAVLVGGFVELARRHGLPLRILEVGASAGLNLRWDRYRYDTGASAFGPPDSPLRFDRVWDGPGPLLDAAVDVAERAGCDRAPIDPTTPEGRLALQSFLWPDQPERRARLDAAIAIAHEVPVTLEAADAVAWLGHRLAAAPGVTTVVVHSIVLQYLSRQDRRRLRDLVAAAGASASKDAPLAWLRLEPAGEQAELWLSEWPAGRERLLARSGFHGAPIRWVHRSAG